MEARIAAVHTSGHIGPSQKIVDAYLDHLRGLAPFDLGVAQRYLLLASQVPGVWIKTSLRPSAEGGGTLDLDVELGRKPSNSAVAVQNTGPNTLGPWSAATRMDLNSFTAFGERTSVTVSRTIPDPEQWIVQLAEEARIGDAGAKAQAFLGFAASRPGGALAPLNLRGRSVLGSAQIQYPIVESPRQSLALSAGLEAVDQRTIIPRGGVLSEDRLRVVWLRADGRVARTSSRGLTAAGNASVELRKGLAGVGASRRDDPDRSRAEGRADAWVMRFEGQGHVTYQGVDVALRSQAQYADRPLLGYEEQAVGRLTIGQGYEPAVLSGDRAAAAELKLRATPFRASDQIRLAPFLLFDSALVANLDAGARQRTLRSAAVGLEAQFPHGMRAKLACAYPFDNPFPRSPMEPSPRVLFEFVLAQ